VAGPVTAVWAPTLIVAIAAVTAESSAADIVKP
jgi:hypothetical protein